MLLPTQTELFQTFSAFLTESGLSAVSIKNYLSDLRHFLAFCSLSASLGKENSETLPQSLTIDEIFQSVNKYINLYTENQKAVFTPQATTNRRLASIRRFTTFLQTKYNVSISLPETINFSPITPIGQNTSSPVYNQNKNWSSNNSKLTPLSTDKVLEQFKSSLEKEKKTHSTIKNYLSDLNHFFLWTANQTPYTIHSLVNILSESQLSAYITYLKLSRTSTSVINRRQSSIKKLTKFCASQAYIPSNPFEIKPVSPTLSPLSWLERFNSKPKKVSSAPKNRFAAIYHRYNSLPFTPYLHLAILVLATSAMVVFGYNQIIKQASPSSAATALTPPRRQLSFQGRLTDSAGTPISTAVNILFKLWNHPTAGSQLYTSSTCSITPDQFGIFNTLIGDGTCGAEIAASVFSDNRDVYLELTVGAETLTPRQQIATVGYALNSETLQGYPASAAATINTVPVVDNLGNINISASSPSVVSTSGTFTLKGQSLSLQTAANSGGSVIIQPDALGGNGNIQLITAAATGNQVRATNANLTSGNLLSGYVGNDSATGRLLSLTSGSTETDRFYVAANGRTGINASANTAALVINQTSTGDLIAASASGTAKFTVDVSGNTTIAGTLAVTGATTLNGNTTLGDAITDNITFTGRVAQDADLLPITTTGTNDLGSALLPWDNVYANVFTQNGNLVCDASGANCPAGSTYWTQASGVLYPTTTTNDFAIGGTTLAASIFSIDESSGTFLFGGDQSANPTLTFEATDSDTANITFDTSDTFSVSGGFLDVNSNAAFGDQGTISTTTGVHISEIFTDTSGALYGTYSRSWAANGSDSSASYIGIAGNGLVDSSVSSNITGTVVGVSGYSSHVGTGTVSSIYGIFGQVDKASTGPVTNAYGIYSLIRNTNATNAITNAYGLYIDNSVETGTITNDYGIYQVDTGAFNYFGGNVGIGDTTPTASLTVGSGDLFQVAGASGNITTAGDLAVNGDDITSDGTLSILGATGLNLRATTGTVTLDSIAASQTINIGASNVARTLNIGTGTAADTINIGTGGTTADTIVIGSTLASTSLTLNDDNWNITGAGAANFVSIGAATPGTGVFTNLSSTGNTTIGDAVGDTFTINPTSWTATPTISGLITATSGLTSNGTLTANGIANIGDGGDAITLSGTTVTLTANGAGNDITANLVDNNTDALDIQQGANNYININTTDASENISFGNATTNPSFSFLGSGTATFTGDIAVNGGDITTTAGTFNVANAATTLNLGSTNITRAINLGTGTAADTINIGTGGTTADTIVIGSTLASTSLTLNDDNWNVTGAGAANFVSIGAATPGTGSFTTFASAPTGTNDITLTTDADSTLTVTGLQSGSGTALCVDGSNNVVTCTTGSGGVSGSGTAGQIAFFNGANSITSETSGFGWDSTNDRLTITSSNTTGTTASFTDTALTTGRLTSFTSTNNSAANTAWSANLFSPTNAQGTTAVSTGSIAGLDLQFTQNTSIAGNTETAARINLAQNDSSSTDAAVASLLDIANNDTATGNQITVTDGLKITGTNVTNGINLSGTFGTNLITSTNFSVTQAGAITGVGVNSGTGLIQGTGGLTVTGTTNINSTGTATTNIGNSTGALTIASGGTSSWTNTSGNLTIQTATSGTMTVDSAGALNLGTTNSTSTTLGKAATTLTINPTSWTATPTISGLITATLGLTSNGTLTANGIVTLGDNGDTVAINSSDWDISTTGDMTGIGSITADGAISTTSTLNVDGSSTLNTTTLDANSNLTFTSGTGSLVINSSLSNASDQVIDIAPAFAGGATDALTYTIIDIAAFSPTNGAGTDLVNGVEIGALTDPGATITSTALKIGAGWDNVLTVNGTSVINGSGQLVSTQLTGTLFSTSADSGSSTVVQGDTLAINGGSNGIDTSLSGDTYTLNLDTTEIGTTTFNAGSTDPVWTFNTSGATDPTLTFANSSLTIGSAATIATDQTTLTLFNTAATAINFAGAAATLSIGAGTGTATINNATTAVAGNLTVAGTTGATLSGAGAGLTFSGTGTHAIANSSVGTNLTIDAGTTGQVQIGGVSTGDVLLAGGAGTTGCTVTNATGILTCSSDILPAVDDTASLGNATTSWSRIYLNNGINDQDGTEVISVLNKRLTGGDWTATGNLTIQGTTGLTFNTNAGGDITFANGEKIDNDIDGSINITAGTLELTGGTTIHSDQTTVALLDTTTTTLNFARAATAINMGAASGTITLGSNSTINGGSAANDDITIQGTSNSTRDTSYVNLQPSGGFVGIGDTTPDAFLDVVGTTALSNATSYTAITERTLTGALTGNTTNYGLYNLLTINGTDATFSHTVNALSSQAILSNGNTIDSMQGGQFLSTISSATLSPTGKTATSSAGLTAHASNNSSGIVANQYGVIAQSTNASTGTVDNAYGNYGQAFSSAGTGTITTAMGARNLAFTNVDGSTIGTAIGVQGLAFEQVAHTTGGVTSSYGGYFQGEDAPTTFGVYTVATQNTAGTYTNAYALYADCINNHASSTITNCYGVRGVVTETAGTITNAYAGYFDAGGTAANNYAGIFLNGNVGIGTITPSSLLDIRSETSAQIEFDDTTDGIAGYIGAAAHILTSGSTDYLGVRGESGINFGVNGAIYATMDSSGNLGIGDTTPAALFAVGSASSFTVDNSGNIITSGNFDQTGSATFNTGVGNVFLNGNTRITISSGTALDIISSGITTDVSLQNGETINNDTDGTVAINDGGGTGLISVSTTLLSLNLTSTDQPERLCHGGADASRAFVQIGDCAVGGADFAEYSLVENADAEPGDLVFTIGNDPQDPAKTLKQVSIAPYQKVTGIISTNPFIEILGETQYKNDPRSFPIGLAGKVPVKVSLENGPIRTGDPLVSSSYPGVAMKGTKASQIIGYAEENYDGTVRISPQVLYQENAWQQGKNGRKALTSDPSRWPVGVGKIMTDIKPHFYDPDAELQNANNIILASNTLGGYDVSTPNGVTSKIGAFASATVANFKAGLAVVNEIVTDNLTVRTKLVSPIADIDQLKVIDATISGTLYADNIKGQTVSKINTKLDLLDERYSTASAILADLQSKYTSYDSLLGSISTATTSGDPFALSPLATTSALIPSDLALNSLNVHTLIGNDIMANGSIFTKSISSFDTDLYIQPNGDKPVHLLASLMTLHPDGKVIINGDLIITGTLYANNFDTKTATISGSTHLNEVTASSLAVGSIDSSGSAKFGNLTTDGLIIAAGNTNENSSNSAQTSSNTTIGTATIASGSSEVVIANTKVTDNTLVYITPISDTNNQVLYVKSKQSGTGFTVAVPSALTNEASFNYWLIQTQ